MLEIADVTSNLEYRADGIWLAPRRSEMSHPEQCQDWYRSVEEDSYWYRHRAECIVECLRQFPPTGPVLDVGGGNGHVSLAIQQAGFDPVLVEPSMQAAMNARARGIKSVICATLSDARFQDDSLSAVGAFDVLEHVEDDAGFVADVHRALKPSGRFYLTVPAFRFLWSAYDDHVGHFRRYTLGSLGKLLRDGGFQVEQASYLYGLLPLPIFLFRSLPTWLGLRGRRNFQRFQKEYAPSPNLFVRILESLLRLERHRLRQGGNLAFGSSCLFVARSGHQGS